MDEANQKKLNLVKLLELSISIEKEIQALQGKEVTLVVGNTGSGKSTLIDYLLKNKLIKVEDEDTAETFFELDYKAVNETKREENNTVRQSARIGHDFVAETLYPKGFETEDGLLLCDTAGFGDNRSPENDASTYMAVQLIIKNIALIKGIVVVISAREFDGRARQLNKTLSLLQRLIAPNKNCVRNYENSVIFVFTHAENAKGKMKTDTQIKNLIKKKRIALKTELTGSPNDDCLEASIALCNVLLSEKIQIVVFDPVSEEGENQFRDKPSGRDRILYFIKQSDGIAKEDIAFKLERIFQDYSDIACQIASSFLKAQRAKVDNQECIIRYKKKLEEIENEIPHLRKEVDFLEQYGKEDISLEEFKARQDEKEKKIKYLENEIKNKRENQISILKSKHTLENDTTHVLVHTEDLYLENSVYGEVQKGVVHSKYFDYSQNYPIARVDYVGGSYSSTEGSSQKFSSPTYNSDRTHCKIRYDGPSHEYGCAEFKVYSEKRFTPDAKCKIDCYVDELEIIKKQLDELTSDFEEAKKEEKDISKHILEIEAQNLRDTEELIKSKKEIIETREKRQKTLFELLKESRQNFEKAKNVLNEEDPKYHMLKQFNEIVPFEEQSVQEFIHQYEIYKQGCQFQAVPS